MGAAAHALPTAEVIRLSVRLRVVAASPALDRLLADGTLDAH